jgi:hypothetical protein
MVVLTAGLADGTLLTLYIGVGENARSRIPGSAHN